MAAPACNDGTCDTNVKATYMICSNVPSLSSLCWLLNSSLSPGRQSFTFHSLDHSSGPKTLLDLLWLCFYLGPSFGRFTGLPSCEQTHRKTQNPFETYINTEPPTPTRYYYSCLAINSAVIESAERWRLFCTVAQHSVTSLGLDFIDNFCDSLMALKD